MFDKKKLEAFLKALEVETHYPMKAPVAPAERSALDKLMDKYDLFTQLEYRNVGTPEMPIWAPPEDKGHITMSMLQSMYSFATYGSVMRSPMRVPLHYTAWDMGYEPDPPKETPYEKLQNRVGRLNSVKPEKIADPKPKPPAPPKSPDFVHTITAWRAWDAKNGILEAVGSEHQWIPKVANRAQCKHYGHKAPQFSCSCGFWSFKTLKLLLKSMPTYAANVTVVGTVEIWGRVIECEFGFRSEFAYPKELWLLNEGQESLSWTYGVPVRRMESAQ